MKLIQDAESVCVDADDTTANFFTYFLDYYNSVYGTSFSINDFWTRKFHLVLGCTGEEAQKRVDEFQHSPYFKKILPLEGSVEGINQLFARGKKLYVTTSRSDYTKEDTERFYDSYFRDKFLDIFYSSNNHTGKANSGKAKWEICRDLNAPLIDDDLSYIIPCAEMAVGGILFGNYLWQRDRDVPANIPRAKIWEEILNHEHK